MPNSAETKSEHIKGYRFEDLKIGMAASFTKTVTDSDVVIFSEISGDTNPVHLDENFAKETRFGGRIVHGMLCASFISTVLGTKLPGPGSIYLSQTLAFKAPVRIGDTVEARATVANIVLQKRQITIKTECRVGSKVVIEGEALIWCP